LIAIDETIVKANKKKFYVFFAIDIEKNELVLIKSCTTKRRTVRRIANLVEKSLLTQRNDYGKALRLNTNSEYTQHGIF